MTDHPEFLRAILEDPDNDTPRLVYADWLQEQGQDERAEFIRVQCAIPQCERCDGDGKAHGSDRPFEWNGPNSYPGECPECGTLRRRERELLADPSVSPSQPHVSSVVWRRGFIEAVTCTASDWHLHGKAILAAQPVRRVRLHAIDLNEATGVDCIVEGARLRMERYENRYIITHVDGNIIVYSEAVINGPTTPNPAP